LQEPDGWRDRPLPAAVLSHVVVQDGARTLEGYAGGLRTLIGGVKIPAGMIRQVIRAIDIDPQIGAESTLKDAPVLTLMSS
jgi:hypothetical protein